MESLDQARHAPPVGRALRIVLGLALMAYVVPVYFQIPARISMRVLLLNAWITWSLQPNTYPDIATNHYLWFVRRGHRGGGIAYSIVRGKPTPEYRSSVAGKVNWQQSRSSASHWWWLACVPLLVAK